MSCLLENEKGMDSVIHDGGMILQYQKKLIEYACKVADEADFDGHRVLVVNSQCLNSEIGHELAKNGIHVGLT
jgi:hypothetical protein